MANLTRNFIAGRMNKTFDQRVVPDGEYIDAMNIRMGSTEKSEAGVIENTKGNLPLTTLEYSGKDLSTEARTIGAIADSARETMYWFVHDPNFGSNTGKLDLIVSYNITTFVLTYHIISVDDGGGVNTTLNFNPQYLITGVDIIENLLFWTDDYNAPRFLNIKRGYANPDLSGIDNNGNPDLLAESILVIKKPPTESPTLDLVKLSDQSNFLEERFICFAYRYRYSDGEYSAISQWTEPAFFPKAFEFSENTFLNEGMTNEYNGVNVTFNTGGPLVIGVDLLFKEATSNVIKVIEKFNKQDVGWSDNSLQTYLFSNSKIYTILPESELLRLFDNVPRYAKAQTIMGNRMMYGNYVDGYNLVDKNGFNVNLDYTTKLISNDFTSDSLLTSLSSGNYTIDTPLTVPNSILNIDLTGISLNEGYSISVDIKLKAVDSTLSSWNFPDVTVSFSYFLNRNYTSVYELATSTEFKDFIGTALNIKPAYVYATTNSCDGTTITDIINCAYKDGLYLTTPPSFTLYAKYECGITGPNEPIKIISSPSSNILSLQFLATRYISYPIFISDTYAYYEIIENNASINFNNAAKSLHSNRDYEIGIVYMDEFNRSTPANVSQFNTEHIPCGNSPFANSITVTIPPTQVAPYWAKRYKFVCKADMAGYETIYSNIWFVGTDNQTYFLLQGENAQKVQDGDRFIVKTDTNGPLTTCAYATVLSKQSYAAGDISTSPDNPAGVYMQINVDSFTTTKSDNAVIDLGRRSLSSTDANVSPKLAYTINIPGTDPSNPTWTHIDYTVPAGSIIVFDILFERKGFGAKACETRIYKFKKTYTSSANYDNIMDWFNGDNISSTIDDGVQDVGGANCPIDNVYIPTPGILTTNSLCTNYWQFYRNSTTNQLYLQMSGTTACSGWDYPNKRKSSVIASITVFRAVDNIIFETEPLPTLPDVFFENNLSFPIDADGNHLSNGSPEDISQNIALGISGEIQTGFFNCFTFGNGAESYKIRDSIIGKDFNLGNRVTTVAAQDYKESRRFADITYSGVYNPETNVNKLNEFNGALLNYKNLELSFGAIYVLDGRETDVLVLQEDRVSYVLAGKNLLSDAAAGGAITSVPEVLGTQIARTEKYGISFNPESYVQWGYDRFFTDAKRGAVLQLKGNAYSNEQLTVISEQNMRTWFRDTFNGAFNTQKLGGFDPYMNEYVLSVNDIKLPSKQECVSCNVYQTFTFAQGEGNVTTYDYCIAFDKTIGKVEIIWDVLSIDPTSNFQIDVTYDGIVYSSGITTTSGLFDFFKSLNIAGSANVTLKVTGNVVLNILATCPLLEKMTMVRVVITNNDDAGESIMTQFNYNYGSYISALQSTFAVFSSGTTNPLVSSYIVTGGYAGTGSLPPEGATMTMQTNINFPWASYIFNPLVDKFRYARAATLYNNNSVDMNTLLGISSIATPILNPSTGIYNASFTVPPSSNGEYLYLIWDFRQPYAVDLCYDTMLDVICCDCEPCTELCSYYTFSNPSYAAGDAIIEFPLGLCGSPTTHTETLAPGATVSLCVPNLKDAYVVTQGEPIIYMENCYCPL